MDIPDNWLDDICKGCKLFVTCTGEDLLCNCSSVLYDMIRAVELYMEKDETGR